MLYYRVVTGGKAYRCDGYPETICGELYTCAEVKRYRNQDKYGYRMHMEWLEPVQVSKHKTYWMFGARYAAEGEMGIQ